MVAGIGLDVGVCFSIQAEGTINTAAMIDFAVNSLLAATNAFPGKRSVVLLIPVIALVPSHRFHTSCRR